MPVTVPVAITPFNSTAGLDVTVTFPTGSMLAGDVIYVWGGGRGGGMGSTLIGPGGANLSWETVVATLQPNATTWAGLWRARWNGVAASEIFKGAGVASNSTNYLMMIVRGHPPAATNDVLAQVDGAGGSVTAPAATAKTGVNEVAFIFAMGGSSVPAPGTVSGYTTNFGNVIVGGAGCCSGCGYKGSAGVVGLAPAFPSQEIPPAWSAWSAGNSAVTLLIEQTVTIACTATNLRPASAVVKATPVLNQMTPLTLRPSATVAFAAPAAKQTRADGVVTATTLAIGSSGWQGKTLRQRFAPGLLSAVAPGAIKVQLTFAAGTSGQIDALYIGHAAASGDAYDFDGAQMQLKFAGAATKAVSGAVLVYSDAAVGFVYDPTKPLIVAAAFSGTAVNLAGYGG